MKKKKNNMRKNVLWNTIGVFTISLTSFIYSLILVRLCNLNITGIWSYSFALACTTVTLASFGGRTYQVTDVKNEIPTYVYISSRYITVTITIFLTIAFILFKGFDLEKAIIIFLLSLFKYCEELSDVYYGVLQKHDYLYVVGKSMFFKSIINILLFFITILLSKSLLLAVVLILLNNLLFLILYDRRKARKLEKIEKINKIDYYKKYFKNNLIICLILFLSIFLVNCSKYVMGNYLSNEIQGIFNVLLLPATAVSLIGSFIINPILVNISVDFSNNEMKKIKKSSFKIIIVLLVFGLLLMLGGYIFGPILYKIIYNFDLNEYMKEFLIIMLGCTFYTISTILSMIFITLRKLKSQLVYNIILSIAAYILCVWFVKNYGITGGVYSYAITMFIRFIIYLIMLLNVKEEKKNEKTKSSTCFTN